MLPGLINDQKKVAALILNTIGEKKEEKMEQPIDQVGLNSAAEEIMSAVKTNSLSGLVGALKSFIELVVQAEEMKEEIGETLEGESAIESNKME